MNDGEDRSVENVTMRAKAMQAARARHASPSSSGSRGGAGQMGIGLRISIELVAAVAIGTGIGWALDRWFGSSPWLLVAFVPMGFVAGIFNVMRVANAHEARVKSSQSPPGGSQTE
ncbi:MAG: AtpZ/AtpI family protein [Proteobacteria bacterium]|nr:AtpZ/AtpI family protein [Pseudomonadota bacterium]